MTQNCTATVFMTVCVTTKATCNNIKKQHFILVEPLVQHKFTLHSLIWYKHTEYKKSLSIPRLHIRTQDHYEPVPLVDVWYFSNIYNQDGQFVAECLCCKVTCYVGWIKRLRFCSRVLIACWKPVPFACSECEKSVKKCSTTFRPVRINSISNQTSEPIMTVARQTTGQVVASSKKSFVTHVVIKATYAELASTI